jgi:hypothetical protein
MSYIILTGRWCDIIVLKPSKPKLVFIIFKNLVRTTKKTQNFTITKLNGLTLFKEIITVYKNLRIKETYK